MGTQWLGRLLIILLVFTTTTSSADPADWYIGHLEVTSAASSYEMYVALPDAFNPATPLAQLSLQTPGVFFDTIQHFDIWSRTTACCPSIARYTFIRDNDTVNTYRGLDTLMVQLDSMTGIALLGIETFPSSYWLETHLEPQDQWAATSGSKLDLATGIDVCGIYFYAHGDTTGATPALDSLIAYCASVNSELLQTSTYDDNAAAQQIQLFAIRLKEFRIVLVNWCFC